MPKKQARVNIITLPNGEQVTEDELSARAKRAAAVIDDPNSTPAEIIEATQLIVWCAYGDPPVYYP